MNSVRHVAILHLFCVISLAVLGTLPAGADTPSNADLSVNIGGFGNLLLPGARYNVAITNNGPAALTSATVVVQLDSRATSANAQPCPFDPVTDTLTCSFGPLAAGSTAILNPSVLFLGAATRTTFYATATRTASTPTDPNTTNDSDTSECWYDPQLGGPLIPVWPVTRCAPL